MAEDRFEKLEIGQTAEILHTVTADDVDQFVSMSGDNNPLHVDDDYAKKLNFPGRVVHGMVTASFISTMIGTKLPGEGSLWFEQQLRFLAPVHIGQTIRVFAKILRKSNATRVIVLETTVFGEGDKKVIDGQAKIKVLK